jgi:hypothetical protein
MTNEAAVPLQASGGAMPADAPSTSRQEAGPAAVPRGAYFWALLPVACVGLAEIARMASYELTLGCRGSETYLGGLCVQARLVLLAPTRSAAFTLAGLPARIVWHGAAIVTVLAAVGVYCAGLWLLATSRPRSERRFTGWVIAAAVVWSVVLAELSFGQAHGFVLVLDLLRADGRLFAPSGAAYLGDAAGAVRAVTFAGVVPLVLAAGLTLVPRGEAETPANLARQMGRLRVVLYLGAGLLVTAVVEFNAFLRWIAVGVGTDQTAAVSEAIGAAVGSVGVLYACYLAIVFVPAALVLAARAASLAVVTLPDDPPKRQGWLDAVGLTASWPRFFTNLLAVLSPFLIGSPLAKLLDLVS